MSLDHPRFRYSVTCHTEDEAVLFCLRSLCQFSEGNPKPQIGWGGTGTDDWKKGGKSVTFRFTDPKYRSTFLSNAERLLRGHFTVVGSNDSDPATPQRA